MGCERRKLLAGQRGYIGSPLTKHTCLGRACVLDPVRNMNVDAVLGV